MATGMIRYLYCLFPVALFAQQVNADASLVVSIKPLQLLAEAVVGGHGKVRTLVAPTDSPHHYTMTPSDRLALESADLIVYIGEELETELHSVLTNLDSGRPVIRLLDGPGIQVRPLAGIGAQKDEKSVGRDPHIWLDNRNGLAIAAIIRDELVRIDSDARQAYADNYERLAAGLAAGETRWRAELESVPELPYAVYHDAIGYFESRFNRRHSLVLVHDPEIPPGIRHILDTRQAIEQRQPACLFTDLTARQNTIDTVLAGHDLRQVRLDLLGSRMAPGEGYVDLFDNLVDDFRNCLVEVGP